jgi:hypothetical protein
MDLTKLSFDELMETGTVTAKNAMFAPASTWNQIPVNQLQQYWESFSQDDIKTGHCALYLKPHIDYYDAKFYWVMLDVENKDAHHESITKNIETARKLYLVFDASGIASDLVISLTGNGFRFTLPYITPYQYSEAFLKMTRDEPRFPGIDPSPFKNGFLRVLGYRNNTRQNRSPKDVHIHTLDSAGQILTVDENKYKRLVAGEPDLERCRLDLRKIIPRGFAPQSFIEILDGYKLQILLGSTIGAPQAGVFHNQSSVNIDQILSFAEEGGYNPREHKWSEGIIYKLDRCPVCNESEGSPYITSYGTLKCHRATCTTGDGRSPYKWVDGYDALESEDQTPSAPTERYTLEGAREQVSQKLQLLLSSDNHGALNAEMGVGKTVTAIKVVTPLAMQRRILFTAPTKQLAEEIYETAQLEAQNEQYAVPIIYIKARNEENCDSISKVKVVAKRGYTPLYVACMGCSGKNGCAYFKQYENLPPFCLIVATHDTAKYHQSQLAPDTWIIDESPMPLFFNTCEAQQVDVDLLEQLETDDTKPLFGHLRDIAYKAALQLKEYAESRIYIGHVPPGPWEDAPTLEKISPVFARYMNNNLLPARLSLHMTENPDNPLKWERNIYEYNVQLEAVRFFDHILAPGDNALSYIKINRLDGRPEIAYVVSKYTPLPFDDMQVIYLDGTMYEPEVHAMFPANTEIINIKVGLDHCHKVFVKSSGGKIRLHEKTKAQMQQDLGMLIEQLRQGDQKVLVITHKVKKDEVLSIAKALRPDLEFGAFHFWGPRGVNMYADFDACIVYGTPTARYNAVVDFPMMLFDERKDIDAWVEALRQRDLAQCIYRIRPLSRSKTIILMGSYWPTGFMDPPDIKIDLMRKGELFGEAKQRLLLFVNRFGFINKAAGKLLRVFTEIDNARAVSMDAEIRTGRGASELVSTLIKELYKSGNKLEGTPYLICLEKSGIWGKLINEIQVDTGLSCMQEKSPGAGKPPAALGTAAAVHQFSMDFNLVFDSSAYLK